MTPAIAFLNAQKEDEDRKPLIERCKPGVAQLVKLRTAQLARVLRVNPVDVALS